MNDPKRIPKELDAIADMVLAYRPNPKSKPAKKRKALAKKLAKLSKSHSEMRKDK
jgi:hypothetical protein